MDFEKLLQQLCQFPYEKEWLEFKENWLEPNELGEYISALSNAAASQRQEYAYFIWGVSDSSHEIVGTTFDPDAEVQKEPLKHFLLSQLYPENNFSFFSKNEEGKKVVILQIPAAKGVPLSWKGTRYVRIGSSKENLSKYPEKEAELFRLLFSSSQTIETLPSRYQNLSFNQLLVYYVAKGIPLRAENFKENLGLLTPEGEYNLMAQLLSDDSHVSIRMGTFLGKTKADSMYTVREFGHQCLLLSLDDLLRYADILNIPQADETNRVVERKEVSLFDRDAFREAAINAFVHNDWANLLEPMFTVYSDRIEIVSRGKLPPGQSLEGFFAGKSVPVNKKLSDIFLQLHISERVGRGVPRIVEACGRRGFEFDSNSIVVTIPLNKIQSVPWEPRPIQKGAKQKPLCENYEKILALIRENPNLTKSQIAKTLGVGKTTVDRALSCLKQRRLVARVGANKNGHWKAE